MFRRDLRSIVVLHFPCQIESTPSQNVKPKNTYTFAGPVRFSKHCSPTIGRLTNLDNARLYSTWKSAYPKSLPVVNVSQACSVSCRRADVLPRYSPTLESRLQSCAEHIPRAHVYSSALHHPSWPQNALRPQHLQWLWSHQRLR